LIVPKPHFRVDPDRTVYVHGDIDENLVSRLTPRIVLLQSKSRDPITVSIDSNGGNAASMREIWTLLKASNQDGDLPCHIITTVTSKAASAAADLLSSGDYSTAQPKSTLLYHGVRITSGQTPLTLDLASRLAMLLRSTNQDYAKELLGKIEGRFMFRFLLERHRFPKIKEDAGKEMTDTECFLHFILASLSDSAKKIFEAAKSRRGRYDDLLKATKRGKRKEPS
jgi:ATP-dependent protease ClpP protease subunit